MARRTNVFARMQPLGLSRQRTAAIGGPRYGVRERSGYAGPQSYFTPGLPAASVVAPTRTTRTPGLPGATPTNALAAVTAGEVPQSYSPEPRAMTAVERRAFAYGFQNPPTKALTTGRLGLTTYAAKTLSPTAINVLSRVPPFALLDFVQRMYGGLSYGARATAAEKAAKAWSAELDTPYDPAGVKMGWELSPREPVTDLETARNISRTLGLKGAGAVTQRDVDVMAQHEAEAEAAARQRGMNLGYSGWSGGEGEGHAGEGPGRGDFGPGGYGFGYGSPSGGGEGGAPGSSGGLGGGAGGEGDVGSGDTGAGLGPGHGGDADTEGQW